VMCWCAFKGGSPFLRKVNDILTTELKHLPGRYSLTALLNMWVRSDESFLLHSYSYHDEFNKIQYDTKINLYHA